MNSRSDVFFRFFVCIIAGVFLISLALVACDDGSAKSLSEAAYTFPNGQSLDVPASNSSSLSEGEKEKLQKLSEKYSAIEAAEPTKQEKLANKKNIENEATKENVPGKEPKKKPSLPQTESVDKQKLFETEQNATEKSNSYKKKTDASTLVSAKEEKIKKKMGLPDNSKLRKIIEIKEDKKKQKKNENQIKKETKEKSENETNTKKAENKKAGKKDEKVPTQKGKAKEQRKTKVDENETETNGTKILEEKKKTSEGEEQTEKANDKEEKNTKQQKNDVKKSRRKKRIQRHYRSSGLDLEKISAAIKKAWNSKTSGVLIFAMMAAIYGKWVHVAVQQEHYSTTDRLFAPLIIFCEETGYMAEQETLSRIYPASVAALPVAYGIYKIQQGARRLLQKISGILRSRRGKNVKTHQENKQDIQPQTEVTNTAKKKQEKKEEEEEKISIRDVMRAYSKK